MEKKIVVIGAGIAGLSAGCYARMNGYEAEIYEAHNIPGGLCTSWKRGEYTIDGCLQWLTGSAPGNSFYRIWKELGAIQGRKMYDREEFCRFTGTDGRTFIAYCNVDRLEKHMKDLSPDDAETTELFCRLVRKFTTFEAPLGKAFELYSFTDYARMMWKMLPYMKDLGFCTRLTIGDFAGRFKDPFLREVFPMIIDSADMSLFVLVTTMALLHIKAGGFPEGGSLAFARSIEQRFISLGGKVFYDKSVEKILVKDGSACGIQLQNGEQISAGYVISCADLRTTVYKMLNGKYIEPQHEVLFRTAKIYHSSVQVSFGMNMDLTQEPGCVADITKLEMPMLIGDEKMEWLRVYNYSFDETLAPKGKTVVLCLFPVENFDYWEKLYADKAVYKAEKERIASVVAEELERKYPGFKSCIEITDVLSPGTYVRYTGNYHGTYMTWVMTPNLMKRYRLVKKTLPGLKNFWLSGMWVQPPGGVPSGAKSSRDILQLICRQDNKKFRTSET
ncbi:MAG: NAD(P)/FAD-dependent oxidoreductase [Bacteroidota bacterium]